MSLSSQYDKKRKRRTKEQIEQLDRQIIDVLREDHPQSVRHVFYRMTDPRLHEPVPKIDKGKNNGYRAVQYRLTELRRSGKIPYHWITDSTRRGYYVNTYQGASDFLRSMNHYYRHDLWNQSDYYCEVWTESRSIAGVIEKDCQDLAVSLYPAGGFSSISLAYEAADYINQDCQGKPVVVFFIGDYDPAGVLIDKSIEKELRKHLDPSIDFHFKRIGITPEQIELYDLPTKPRKKSDKRSLHIKETVEAEAMPAATLREILRNHVEALLPQRALEVAKVAEESERSHILQWAEMMEGN